MTRLDALPRTQAAEGELYYLQVPTEPRPVVHALDFVSMPELLEDEATCRAIWDVISAQFKTRSKFLSIWPSVRYVATHHRGGELAGFLLVSAPINWQIDYVVVRPEFRGQGIAEALVNATVNEALARRVPYVMLTSREGLRPLYESACGFTVVGQKGDPRTNSDRPANAARDHLELKISC
ncbi:MAG TPA: GNAT family N-acetyltransferase [Gemmataceae bacterium]|nr:GNAT family N-acetyltransferase [Gemmataceae bacterium]